MTKGYRNLKEVKAGCKQVKSVAAESDAFMYKCFPLLTEQMVEINQSLKRLASRKKRTPSAYNIYIGEQMRQGKTLKEAAQSWLNESSK